MYGYVEGKEYYKKSLSLFLAFIMIFSFITVNTTTIFAYDEEQIEINQNEIENEVRFIFSEASSFENGKLTVKKQLLEDKYGKEMATYIEIGLHRLYYEDNLVENLRKVAYGEKLYSYRSGFIDCMKGEIIGMIPGVDLYQLFSSGNLKSYIEGKAWGKIASIIGKQLIKLGLKSNVAGLIASLGISAGKCAIFN